MRSSTLGKYACAVITDVFIYGTDGTLRLLSDATGELALWAGSRNDDTLKPVVIPDAKRGGWRVEEEFVRAVRREEAVSHTDFATGVHYMRWTDAVALSNRTGERVHLALD